MIDSLGQWSVAVCQCRYSDMVAAQKMVYVLVVRLVSSALAATLCFLGINPGTLGFVVVEF
jgi:hypothetical protein